MAHPLNTPQQQFPTHRRIIILQVGDIRIGLPGDVLISGPLGSCVALILFDKKKRLGGMAHIMLPGNHPADKPNDNRYTETAIQHLIERLGAMGSRKEDLCAFLAGASNVLMREDDKICQSNINSVLNCLGSHDIPILKTALAGKKRRQLTLDVTGKIITTSIGDTMETVFYHLSSISSQEDS